MQDPENLGQNCRSTSLAKLGISPLAVIFYHMKGNTFGITMKHVIDVFFIQGIIRSVTSRNFMECYNLQKYEFSKTFCVEVLVARST